VSLESRTVRLLGPAGVIARDWPDWEPREGQLDMALAVARALEAKGRAVIEAGTGTGKTLAYLVPALSAGLKLIISTATKNLQEQIVFKDLPQLAKLLGLKPEVCLVKGRLNYLCRRRFKKAVQEGFLEPHLAAKLAAWAEASQSGDRAEVDFLAEEDPLWARLTSSSEQCLGSGCDQFNRCFITWLRRRAAAAGLVVANHHLFMADLALKQTGFGQVLPESEAVIFDEAHELEEAASSHFTVTVSDQRLRGFLLELAEVLGPGRAALIEELTGAGQRLFAALSRPGERWVLEDDLLNDEVLGQGQRLGELLAAAGSALDQAQDQDEALGLSRRAQGLADELALILGRLEPDYVYYAERLRRGLSLKAAPVEVAGLLGRTLLNRPRAFVFTSATLEPERFCRRLGLGGPVEELVLASPYDFAGSSLLYVPRSMPLPNGPDFAAACAGEMGRLVEITRGRAFLLFTSFRNLEAVHRLLAPGLDKPWLKQGQAPKVKLMEDFLGQEGTVLFATQSFWQGVDVPGPRLSLVAIDKLPFAPPDDPLIAARLERMRHLGQDPFLEYQLPEAILSLRQGLGRLLRSSSDAGVLAVLDGRLFSKGYGQRILAALPPSPVVRDLDQVARFARERL